MLTIIKGGIPFLTILFKIGNWFKSHNWYKQFHRHIGSMVTYEPTFVLQKKNSKLNAHHSTDPYTE